MVECTGEPGLKGLWGMERLQRQLQYHGQHVTSNLTASLGRLLSHNGGPGSQERSDSRNAVCIRVITEATTGLCSNIGRTSCIGRPPDQHERSGYLETTWRRSGHT